MFALKIQRRWFIKTNYNILVDSAPSELKERLLGLSEVQQRKDFHPEGDVAKHQEIVTNRLVKTGDPDLIMAGVFHDIGKDETTFLKEKNGVSYLTAPGHENISARLVKEPDNAEWISSEGADVNTVWEIVKYHMRIKQYISGALKKPAKRQGMENLSTFKHLLMFSQADSMTKLVDRKRIPYLEVENFNFTDV